jgi:hypothetical protein
MAVGSKQLAERLGIEHRCKDGPSNGREAQAKQRNHKRGGTSQPEITP